MHCYCLHVNNIFWQVSACQVNGPNLGTKFHTYLLQFLRYWDSSWRTRTMTTRRIILLQWRMDFYRLKDSLTHRPSFQGWAPGVLLFICNALCCFVWHCHVMYYIYFIIYLTIRASVDALCRDGAGQISRERVQRGRLTRQGTTSWASKTHR